jgi:hypothetical protein
MISDWKGGTMGVSMLVFFIREVKLVGLCGRSEGEVRSYVSPVADISPTPGIQTELIDDD